jgi:hypothetical protein
LWARSPCRLATLRVDPTSHLQNPPCHDQHRVGLSPSTIRPSSATCRRSASPPKLPRSSRPGLRYATLGFEKGVSGNPAGHPRSITDRRLEIPESVQSTFALHCSTARRCPTGAYVTVVEAVRVPKKRSAKVLGFVNPHLVAMLLLIMGTGQALLSSPVSEFVNAPGTFKPFFQRQLARLNCLSTYMTRVRESCDGHQLF